MELKCVTCEYSAHCWLLILSEKSHLLRCTSHTIHSLVHRIKLLSVCKKTLVSPLMQQIPILSIFRFKTSWTLKRRVVSCR